MLSKPIVHYQFSVNVWDGILENHLVVFVPPPRLNSVIYLNFVRDQLPYLVDDVPLQLRQNMWFMNKGAPAHFSVAVCTHLYESFPNQQKRPRWASSMASKVARLKSFGFLTLGTFENVSLLFPNIDTFQELRLKISNRIQK